MKSALSFMMFLVFLVFFIIQRGMAAFDEENEDMHVGWIPNDYIVKVIVPKTLHNENSTGTMTDINGLEVPTDMLTKVLSFVYGYDENIDKIKNTGLSNNIYAVNNYNKCPMTVNKLKDGGFYFVVIKQSNTVFLELFPVKVKPISDFVSVQKTLSFKKMFLFVPIKEKRVDEQVQDGMLDIKQLSRDLLEKIWLPLAGDTGDTGDAGDAGDTGDNSYNFALYITGSVKDTTSGNDSSPSYATLLCGNNGIELQDKFCKLSILDNSEEDIWKDDSVYSLCKHKCFAPKKTEITTYNHIYHESCTGCWFKEKASIKYIICHSCEGIALPLQRIITTSSNDCKQEVTYKDGSNNVGVIFCEEEYTQSNNIDTNTHKDEKQTLTPANIVDCLCLSLSISVPENTTTEEKFKSILRTKNLYLKKLNTALLEVLRNGSNLSDGLQNLQADIERKEKDINNNLIRPDAKADMFFSSMLIRFRQALKGTEPQQSPYKKTGHSNKTGGSHTYASQEQEKKYNYKEREGARGFRRSPNYSTAHEQKSNAKIPSFESFYNDGNEFKGFSVKFPTKISSWLEDNCDDGLSFEQISDRCVIYSDKDGLVKKVIIRRADDKFILVSKEYVIKINGDYYIKPDVDKERILSFLYWEDKYDFVDEVCEAWATLSITKKNGRNKKSVFNALLQVHPDKNKGNEKQAAKDFQKLYKAYEVLKKHDIVS
ncbi:MAG: J domain-containing protein [Candidatus Endonucleobacter sp. (ex Gigantidas childressi)]|nr:J domain-containing protein [Candidatus Endonucleobacter sp. (ex Gigantidas childressi)]